jgi:hypothetical protein
MKFDKIDALMGAVGVLFLALLIGMATDQWLLTLAPIPVLAAVLMIVGSLDRSNKVGNALLPVTAFSLVLLAGFMWAALSVGSSGTLGGMEMPLGVVYYFIWPFTTLFTGLLYALVYERWLKKDLAVES